MARNLSLNFRLAAAGASTDEIPIVLVTIDHDGMEDGPIRMSSDNADMLTVDPLIVGTYSLGLFHYFVLMDAQVPDEEEGSPTSTTLLFDNVERDMVGAVRSVLTPATVTMQMVLASTPDIIEEEYTFLSVVQATFDANQISLELTRENFTANAWPYTTMGRSRFPGLFE